MNEKSYSDYIIGIIAVSVIIALVVYPASANIPPTPAFSKIGLFDLVLMNATKYNDELFFETTNLYMEVQNNTISISLDYPSTRTLGGVHSGRCNDNNYMSGIDDRGNIICRELP